MIKHALQRSQIFDRQILKFSFFDLTFLYFVKFEKNVFARMTRKIQCRISRKASNYLRTSQNCEKFYDVKFCLHRIFNQIFEIHIFRFKFLEHHRTILEHHKI